MDISCPITNWISFDIAVIQRISNPRKYRKFTKKISFEMCILQLMSTIGISALIICDFGNFDSIYQSLFPLMNVHLSFCVYVIGRINIRSLYLMIFDFESTYWIILFSVKYSKTANEQFDGNKGHCVGIVDFINSLSDAKCLYTPNEYFHSVCLCAYSVH